VTFAGYAAPADYYATTTLFVLPSRYEGMPNALLEAAAAGLPIVATPCCTGVTDLLRGAPGVWCAPVITHEALEATILTALAELNSSPNAPARFDHAFLVPFELKASVSAYAKLFEKTANPQSLAILIPTIDQIGGAESQVLLLAKELATRGWPVTLIALSGNGQATAAELASANVDFLSLEMRKAWIDPRGWLRYRAWFRIHRPAIVHAHLPHATLFARWVRLLAPIRVQIDTIHTSKTTSNSGGPGRRLGYKLSNWLTSQVTCVSEAVANSALTAGLTSREKLRIIPNGVVLPPPPPRNHNESFQWIAVGRLAPVKDYPTLLHAFAALPGQPSLQIVGTGPEEVHLRNLAAELQI
jgi:glycosyltransferase involved in cell wall biosynthesis